MAAMGSILVALAGRARRPHLAHDAAGGGPHGLVGRLAPRSRLRLPRGLGDLRRRRRSRAAGEPLPEGAGQRGHAGGDARLHHDAPAARRASRQRRLRRRALAAVRSRSPVPQDGRRVMTIPHALRPSGPRPGPRASPSPPVETSLRETGGLLRLPLPSPGRLSTLHCEWSDALCHEDSSCLLALIPVDADVAAACAEALPPPLQLGGSDRSGHGGTRSSHRVSLRR